MFKQIVSGRSADPYSAYMLQSVIGFFFGFGYYAMAVRRPKDFKDRATALGIVWVITFALSIKNYFSAYAITYDVIFSLLLAITNSFFAFVCAMLAGLFGKHIIEKEKWR